jgi:hypothetical protein
MTGRFVWRTSRESPLPPSKLGGESGTSETYFGHRCFAASFDYEEPETRRQLSLQPGTSVPRRPESIFSAAEPPLQRDSDTVKFRLGLKMEAA